MEKSSGSSPSERLRNHHSERRGNQGSSGRHASYDSSNQQQTPRKCRGGTSYSQKQTEERQTINSRLGDQSNQSEQETVELMPTKRPRHHYTGTSGSRRKGRHSTSAHRKGAT
ncbi:uncharacterized protein LOC144456771 [Phascolarctos cinereus]